MKFLYGPMIPSHTSPGFSYFLTIPEESLSILSLGKTRRRIFSLLSTSSSLQTSSPQTWSSCFRLSLSHYGRGNAADRLNGVWCRNEEINSRFNKVFNVRWGKQSPVPDEFYASQAGWSQNINSVSNSFDVNNRSCVDVIKYGNAWFNRLHNGHIHLEKFRIRNNYILGTRCSWSVMSMTSDHRIMHLIFRWSLRSHWGIHGSGSFFPIQSLPWKVMTMKN